MKILVVHPGADWATHDVHTGIVNALVKRPVDLAYFALNKRMTSANSWLQWQWRHSGKTGERPNGTDAQYLASVGVIERALRFGADWVFIVSATMMHPDVFVMLKRAGLQTAILFTECPYDDDFQLQFAPFADVCWVNDKASLERFRQTVPQTFYWQHAYDPYRHHAEAAENEPEVPAHDVVFVGTGFEERVKLLEQVDWSGIDLGLYGTWELASRNSPLKPFIHDIVTPNAVTAALYRKAKVGINLHRSSVGFGRNTVKISGAYSLGPRCYELAACGAFYISDYRPELADVFGDAVPTYTNAEELGETIRYYLAHDEERAAKAALLPGLAARHTFDARVSEMLEILEAQGARNGKVSR
jgi:spore maturation protein CgeB